MPLIRTDDGIEINIREDGPADAPPLILSNSLGTNLGMWDAQVARFAATHRVVRYDQRGHGGSSAPDGDYAMARLARDVLSVMDALGIDKADYCGISMGGMAGMWLGANAANRFGRLVLANTTAYVPAKDPWNQRIEAVRAGGTGSIAAMVATMWFTERFRDREPAAVDRVLDILRRTDPTGYVGCCAAVRDMDMRDAVPTIGGPTLVITGARDPATPPEAGRWIASAVAGAQLVELDAAHISNIEQPAAFSDAVLGFLGQPDV